MITVDVSKMEMGLSRIKELLGRLQHPEKHLGLVIHVAGTNGKGSVCAYISTCLAFAGYKVGRFTSPFLTEPFDSIAILTQHTLNRVQTPDIESSLTHTPFAIERHLFESVWLEVSQKCETMSPKPTSFEILTAVAFCIFYREAVDVCVIEVGLGGRDDATNVFETPDMVVITSIGYDHQALLGSTIEEIASKKAGIIKENCPIVIARQSYVEAELTLMNYSKEPIKLLAISSDRQEVLLPDGSKVRPTLHGAHQVDNLCAAMTALVHLICLKKIPYLRLELIGEALKYCYWPGRLSHYQWYDERKTIIVDGAHNFEGTCALRDYLNERKNLSKIIPNKESRDIHDPKLDLDSCTHWLFGCVRDKPYETMLRTLLKPGDVIIFTEFSPPPMMDWIRPLKPVQMSAWVHQNYGDTVITRVAYNLSDAFAQLSIESEICLVICGSLYLVADFYRYLEANRQKFSGPLKKN